MAAPASAEPAASAAAALASIEEAEEALYGPRESIHVRFPGLTGCLLQESHCPPPFPPRSSSSLLLRPRRKLCGR
eukprot:2128265-Pyramimonas_sp.AAC.1